MKAIEQHYRAALTGQKVLLALKSVNEMLKTQPLKQSRT